MNKSRILLFLFGFCGGVAWLPGCAAERSPGSATDFGQLQFALGPGPQDSDVVGVLIEVWSFGGSDYHGIYAPFESETLPPAAQTGRGPGHAFADKLLTVAPGLYDIVVTPMKSPSEPSAACAGARVRTEALAGQTVEVELLSICDTNVPPANIDILVWFQHGPYIGNLELNASKWLVACEGVIATLTAGDEDLDPLTYAWEVMSAPVEATYTLQASGPEAYFLSHVAGDYSIRVSVCDAVSGAPLCSSLTFPLHVQMPDGADADDNGLADACEGGQPVLCELMVNPLDASLDLYGEYIEICNVHPYKAVDLTGWSIVDAPPSQAPVFLPGLIIPPNGRIVAARSDDCSRGGVPGADFVFGSQAGMRLDNAGDRIALRDAGGTVVDELTYPGNFGNYEGYAYERCNLHAGPNDPSNWQRAIATYGCPPAGTNHGTPGTENRACGPGPRTVRWDSNADFLSGVSQFTSPADDALWIDAAAWEFAGQTQSVHGIWVPSSGNGHLVLLDRESGAVIVDVDVSAVCPDPSRIGTDPAGNVFAACRGGTQAIKVAPSGTISWTRDFGGLCNEPRGAIFVPRADGLGGRVYVGCPESDMGGGRLFVLDPENGAIVGSPTGVPAVSGVYGLSSDGVAVYVASHWDGTVQAIGLDGAGLLTGILWTNDTVAPYGIANDGNGHVWAASGREGQVACRLERAGGAARCVASCPGSEGAFARGIAVSPVDGYVWVGLGDEGEVGRVAKIHPVTLRCEAVYDTGAQTALGVGVDGDNVVYVVHQVADRDHVCRLDRNGNPLGCFGGTSLDWPYAPSADMFADYSGCTGSVTGTWSSPLVDMGVSGATISNVVWGTRDTPSSTSVAVEYRIDGAAWTPAPNGSGLSGLGRHIQFRAILDSASPACDVPGLDFVGLTYQEE